MSVEHILTEIVNRPLMITPAKLEVILSILNRRSEQAIAPDFSALMHMNSLSGQEVKAEARPINQVSEALIAVIPVLGSMVARNHGYGEGDGSGLRSYRSLFSDINAAARDPEIGGILLDMDTFGGMSAGCERLTRFLAEVNAVKPVYAVVDLNAYSAGYSIAAACSKIILSDQTAGVGSIGCIAIHCDISGANEKEGLNYTVVTFGAKKDQFSPLRPLAKNEHSDLQKSVSVHGMRFAETVAELRNMKLADVLATEAGAYSGQQAIDIGLADEIASFDETVAMLADDIKTRKKTSFTSTFQSKGENDMPEPMSTKDRIAALLTAEDGPQALADLGYISAAVATGNLEAAVKTATDKAEQQHQQAIAVAEVCQLGQASLDQTVTMLKENFTPEQARESIQQLRANSSKAAAIKSTTTVFTNEGKHPLITACEALKK
ncbi:MAG: S49 family peptidase [Proteobacteria bacterium]|nr:S49 family peptidase [Pseudomonadota bacterium]